MYTASCIFSCNLLGSKVNFSTSCTAFLDTFSGWAFHVLPGQPFRATFAGAPFAKHKLWAMSSIVCLIAPISVRSGPNSGLFQGVHAFVHVAQGPVRQPLSRCLAAEGSDMKTIPSS